MLKKDYCLLCILAILLLIGGACSSTKFYSEFKDDAYNSLRLKKVMVVGVGENEVNRKLFESEMAKEFDSKGVETVRSLAVIPADVKVTSEVLKNKAIELGCDAVLVTHLLGTGKEEIYKPPTTVAIPRNNRFGYYYSNVNDYVHYPGYYEERTYVRLETRLYETTSEKLIWAVSSEIFNPKSVNKVINSLAKAVIKNLRKNSLL